MKEWRGIPREEIPWYPTVDPLKCIGCKACIDCCKNDVFEFDATAAKTTVKNPFNCVVECGTCARMCPTGAISFPDKEAFTAFIKAKLATDKDGKRD